MVQRSGEVSWVMRSGGAFITEGSAKMVREGAFVVSLWEALVVEGQGCVGTSLWQRSLGGFGEILQQTWLKLQNSLVSAARAGLHCLLGNL